MEAVALWVNRKPNKEFDLQMTGSQEVLFWYERTIMGEFRRVKILTCDRKPEVDLEQKLSEPGDLEKVT